jgi:hypothetical protein
MSGSVPRRTRGQPSLVPRVTLWLENAGRYAFGFGVCEMLS